MSDILRERKEENVDQSLRICSVAVSTGVVDQMEHLGKSMAAADTNKNAVKYATCGTGEKFWNVWREQNEAFADKILSYAIVDREITVQDIITSMLWYSIAIIEKRNSLS